MRIDGTRRQDSVARTKTGEAGGRGGVFSLSEGSGASGSARAEGPAPLAGIDALLALQSVGAHTSRGERVRHGRDMLDLLDDIRLGLVCGELPTGRLQRLVDMISRRPGRFEEEGLETVLDEIELRARVELAKHGREAA